MADYNYIKQSEGRIGVLILLTILGRLLFDWPYVVIGLLIINIVIELVLFSQYNRGKYLRILTELIVPYLILAVWEIIVS